MIELLLIGIGSGNPDHLTLEAVKALQTADLILLPVKGDAKADLLEVRREILARHVSSPPTRFAEFDMPVRDALNPDYRDGVERWHDAVAAVWKLEIEAHLEAGRVALLVWGDPSLYDSTLRIAERLARDVQLSVRVIPGLTSIQVLTAAHRIPLNEIGASVLITTGRQLCRTGWPPGIDTLVVMLDGETAFTKIEQDGVAIWWGAYLGLPQEIVISGLLPEVSERIVRTRAAARAENGWIMDIYLLRR
jgi:precorrin-6A synthase